MFPLVDDAENVNTENIDWTKALIAGPLQHGFDYYFGVARPA